MAFMTTVFQAIFFVVALGAYGLLALALILPLVVTVNVPLPSPSSTVLSLVELSTTLPLAAVLEILTVLKGASTIFNVPAVDATDIVPNDRVCASTVRVVVVASLTYKSLPVNVAIIDGVFVLMGSNAEPVSLTELKLTTLAVTTLAVDVVRMSSVWAVRKT